MVISPDRQRALSTREKWHLIGELEKVAEGDDATLDLTPDDAQQALDTINARDWERKADGAPTLSAQDVKEIIHDA